MDNESKILAEVNKTLQSFDNDSILEENPFLFTRIQAERKHRLRKRTAVFGISINLKYVAALLLLLTNLITVAYYYERNTENLLHEQLVSELKQDLQIDQSQNNF